MTSYKFENIIISSHITKELLLQIQNFLLYKLSDLYNIPNEDLKKSLKITICDKNGEEEFNNLETYPYTKFSDDTTQINIELNIYKPFHLAIFIRLSNAAYYIIQQKSIIIKCQHTNSKEITLTIYNSINQIFVTQKHYIRKLLYFTNPIFEGSMIAIISVLISQFYCYNLKIPIYIIYSTLFYFFIIIILFCFKFVLKQLFPLYTFDSKKNDIILKYTNWFFLGLLSFIIFTTLFVYFRKRVIGF